MKVLLIYHSGAMQGVRKIFATLASHDQVDLTVVTPTEVAVDKVYDPSGWLRVAGEEQTDGFRLIPIPLRNPSSYSQGFRSKALRQVMQEVRPDMIHVLDELVSRFLFQVIWLRIHATPRSKVLFYAFLNRPIRLDRRARLRWRIAWSQVAGGVTANSEAIEHIRCVGFPQGRPLERIFWGIPTDVFRPMDQSALRQSLGLDTVHVVGFVGRLVPMKGLTVLLAAIRRLPQDVHCVIIGDGPMRAELELWSGLPDLAGRIHLLGLLPAEEIAKYMNCMDVLAFPSLTTPHSKEQYGRAIAEAMACGVPVVGSDSGAIPEVIDSAGLIVPENDASALAQALNTAIFDADMRARLVQRGMQRAEQEFSGMVFAQKLIDFYNRIIGF